MSSKACAEIIESSLNAWLAQSWDWSFFVPYGSLIVVESPPLTLFGIVYQIQTGSMDPSRHPFPYRKTHAELLAEQPQIFEFLKTTFSCLAVGFMKEDTIFHIMPPQPPSIHSFLSVASAELSKKFFSNDRYLPLLFSSKIQDLDEIILTLISRLFSDKIMSKERLMGFMRTYSLLTSNDYRRMKLFLQRLEPLVCHKDPMIFHD